MGKAPDYQSTDSEGLETIKGPELMLFMSRLTGFGSCKKAPCFMG